MASGVGTLTWLTFLPFAFAFGAVSDRSGIQETGWMLGFVAVLTAVFLVATVRGFVRAPAGVPLEPAFAAVRFRPPDDPEWPGHWVGPPGPWEPGDRVDTEVAVGHVRAAITDLPSPQHEVIVACDVDGRTRAEVRDQLDLTPAEESDLLTQARGRMRTQLDGYMREHPA